MLQPGVVTAKDVHVVKYTDMLCNMHTPVQAFVIPSRRFAHLHVDLVGPLLTSQHGFTYLFTVIDRTTR